MTASQSLVLRLALGTIAVLSGNTVQAQRGGFVATLGRDTVHVESFVRTRDTLRGTIVTRIPATRVMSYTLVYDANKRPVRYEMSTADGNGTPLTANSARGSMTWRGDSLVRETLQNGALVTTNMAIPEGAFPSPSLPYVGVSYLMYEEAIADARRRNPSAADARVQFLTMISAQAKPQAQRVWFVSKDSSEIDYFGVARSGYKFDDNGRLLRSDWRGTTYRYAVSRVNDIDVKALADKWSKLDVAGNGFGALSPRDSAKSTVGAAQIVIDYSRPSQRGRDLWGTVFTSSQAWRLGADMATHFSTSADLVMGDSLVPAGRYTLWMQYAASGPSHLIINKKVNIFGTQYDPSQDFVRIPLARLSGQPLAERLTIGTTNGMFRIHWGDVIWQAPIRVGGQ